MLRRMGFWKEESSGHGDPKVDLMRALFNLPPLPPDPSLPRREVEAFICPMRPSDRAAVLHYMANAKAGDRYMGTAYCRLCGHGLGSADMTTPDGRWMFPEHWDHYVVAHGVTPTHPDFTRDAVRWSAAHRR